MDFSLKTVTFRSQINEIMKVNVMRKFVPVYYFPCEDISLWTMSCTCQVVTFYSHVYCQYYCYSKYKLLAFHPILLLYHNKNWKDILN